MIVANESRSCRGSYWVFLEDPAILKEADNGHLILRLLHGLWTNPFDLSMRDLVLKFRYCTGFRS